MLSAAPYGVYAMDLHQTILFWNRSAGRILGYTSHQAIGHRCYEVLQGIPAEGSPPVCLEGCPSIRHARAGRNAPSFHVWVLCSSGQRKQVTVTPLGIPDVATNQMVLVHLFHERTTDLQTEGAAAIEELLGGRLPASPTNSAAEAALHQVSPLTDREVEIVRLVAQGFDDELISTRLLLSLHTVRNHPRHVREKLHARNRLAIVLVAQGQGLI